MNYIDIVNSNYYIETYSQIEEIKKDFPVNHGFVHVKNVLRHAKKLSNIFNLSKKQKNLLFIACCLHDIGYLKGRQQHALNGSIMAKDYLINVWKMKTEDVNIIYNAIANHGAKEKKILLNLFQCVWHWQIN